MSSLLAQIRDEDGPLEPFSGRGCFSRAGEPKRRYATKGDAKRAAGDLMSLLGGHRLRAYHCASCDQWHLSKV